MGLFSMMMWSRALNGGSRGGYHDYKDRDKHSKKEERDFRDPVIQKKREKIEGGLFYEKIYKDGELVCEKVVNAKGEHAGKCITYGNKSYILKTYNKDGVLDGPYLEVFYHRIMASGNFVKGKKEGKWVSGESYGYYKEENYVNGELNGDSVTYMVDYDEKKIDGKEDMSMVWGFKDKRLLSKCHYESGKRDGFLEVYGINYHTNPRTVYLQIKDLYKNDELVSGEAYYENGQLRKKGTYKDDKLDGPCEKYHENGKLKEKGVYRMGERLDGKEAKEYLKEWNEKHITAQESRKGLNTLLTQIDKQMPPSHLRQDLKRAEVARFRAKFPNKKDGR